VSHREPASSGDILISLHQWETISIDNITSSLITTIWRLSRRCVVSNRGGQLQRGWLPNME
jgi:hypothetical protein